MQELDTTQPTTYDNLAILPDSFLDKIVSILNESLPSFALSCIDIEAEKRYIATHLEDECKGFVQLLLAPIEGEIATLIEALSVAKGEIVELRSQLEQAKATEETLIADAASEQRLQELTERVEAVKSQRQELLASLEKEHQLRVELEKEIEQLRAATTPVESEESWLQYTLPDTPEEKPSKTKKVEEQPIPDKPKVDDSQMSLW